ncbi:MAG TPA: polyvinylalcohol dehydrogenase [Planctomycetaceae bacterium]|nr:polyvinylalcohol dehydrogenase [Planctomycetaceae bacterium]
MKWEKTAASILRWPRLAVSAALTVSLAINSTASAEDWPSWQGPNRDNKSAETGLLDSWPEGGPPLAWQVNSVGLGYSSPSVVGDSIYILGSRDGKSELLCLSVSDGAERWAVELNDKPFDFKGNAWGIGPRAAATVADGRVFALAGDGKLVACSVKGDVLWRVDMQANLGGAVNPIGGGPKNIGWGYCWSPLVDGNKLICVPGGDDGLLAALDCSTGNVLWRSSELKGMATYSSPIVATIGGVKQYIVMTQSGVAGVDASDGGLLWEHVRSRAYSDVVIPTPVQHEQFVYVSVGYGGAGCDLLEISQSGDAFEAKSLYSSRNSKNMKNNLGGFVLEDGHIYGCSDRRGWVCQNLESGKLNWYKRGASGFGDGSLIQADGHLYLFDERDSEVALVKATPEDWNVKGRFKLPAASPQRAPSGRAWTHPVIAGGKLYLRDQELLYSYDISKP